MTRILNKQSLALFLTLVLLSPSAVQGAKKEKARKKPQEEISGHPLLWRDPADIATRNLFYGPGGNQHQPRGTFHFIEEDLDGTNPKFVVRDEDGVKWKVKLGQEARPETAASRLVWAAGYFASEDYFVPSLRAQDMPAHLHRGQKLVAPDGSVANVRLKRSLSDEKKIGEWSWRDDPFSGTRELDGLRVMMALINNWDLKDENNAIYAERSGGEPDRDSLIYMVTDLGASFGTTGLNRSQEKSKGNLDSFAHSKFIRKVTPEYVDFSVPSRPAIVVLVKPRDFFGRLHLEWIGRHIPRSDARWTGQLLARLSPNQIRDAFRAAGYSPREVEGFAAVLEHRIEELNRL